MYEERKEKFSFKSFFLTLLLVLLFVFLMLWLFPNKWDLKNLQLNQSEYDLDRLSVLYDEIFANNVERMKDAAIGYYTNERLPQTVGESSKLTLQQMYDLHLVLKLKDKDGNACDVEESYVNMTKYDNEYRLKVNLKCGDDEDYIIVYLGCYSYCSDGICEKKVTKTEGKVTTITEEVKKTYSCQVINGKYYNKNGNVVSEEDYKKSCETTNTYSCEVVNGKYYDKSGNVVSKTEYTKSCETTNTYSCEVVNGKYYDKSGNVVSKTEYTKSCETTKTYSCEVVNGKYYDKSGNVVSKTEYTKSCETTTKKKMYEYKLTTEDKTTCTAWSDWQKDKVTASSTVKVETKEEKEIVKYNTVTVQTGVKKQTVTKQVQEKYISGYTTKLVYTGEKQVQTGTTTKTVTEKVVAGTTQTFVKVDSGTKVPANTSTYTYEVISQDDVPTCSNCEKEVKYVWNVYKIENVYKTVTKTVTVPVYKTIKTYSEQSVPVYDYKTVDKTEEVVIPIYSEYKVPEYGNVTYYRSKTCKVTKGTTDTKWSYSKNDTALIKKGYKLTGNVKEV